MSETSAARVNGFLVLVAVAVLIGIWVGKSSP